jgi:DNA invertase Pin-like site-specific DNA recombinase
MTKAVGYIRVSTEQQAQDGVSIDNQRDKIQEYCDLYDLELVDVEADEGASGKNMDRDGLQNAVERLEEGEAETMVVVKLDRLTRSVSDLNVLLEKYFSERYDLVSVNEQVNTGTAAGRLVLNVLMSVSQWEREAISERTEQALQHKKANGERVGSIPYGYTLAEDGETLEEDPAEQEVIEAVKDYREGGLSYRAIADRLEEEGFTNREGNRFNPKTIGSILKQSA